MKRTFCTVITDPTADAVLEGYGEIMAQCRHWAFKQIHVLNRSTAKVKSEALKRFGLTGRQFNGVRYDLDQSVNGWRGTLKFRASDIQSSIEATLDKVAALGRKYFNAKSDKSRQRLRGAIAMKRRRVDVLRGRLSVVHAELAAGKPKICFGGRESIRKGDIDGWRMRRNSRIFLVGSKGEGQHGNQSVQWDGSSLTIRLPDAMGGERTFLAGVEFSYGQDDLMAVMKRNFDKAHRVGLTWLLFRDDDGRWRAHVTVEEPVAELKTDIRNGVVSVDLNVDHLAVVFVDAFGNPKSRRTIPFPEAGTDSNVAKAMIGDAVRLLSIYAMNLQYGIAFEDLDFAKKKAALRGYGPAHARRLSGFAYNLFRKMLEARCARDGIDLHEVNPAFTSVIGRKKYACPMAMSPHHAAALVIGRRAQGYVESLRSRNDAILDGPARNRPRTEWSRWRDVRRLPREVAQRAAAWTPGSGTGKRTKGRRKSLVTGSARAGPPTTQGLPHQVGVAVAPANPSACARREACYTPVT